MGILFVFILSMLSDSQAQSGPSISGMICGYGGSNLNSSYTFSIADVPDRCDAIIYGGTTFNNKPTDADTTAIAALTSAGHTVYMLYLPDLKVNSLTIINSNNISALESHIAPMITALNENKVSGVLLSFLNLHSEVINDYAPKIKILIDMIKKCVPSIKVGLRVDGYQSEKFSDPNVFDFNVVNDVVDVYTVDTSSAGDGCFPDSIANGGRTPITTTKPDIITLEDIITATTSSAMDQTKVIVDLINEATTDDDQNKSYSEYCSKTDSNLWCVDSIEILYNEVIFLKKVFKGVSLTYLELDDFDNSCGCGKFPIANNFMDAWNGKPMTCCEKIG